MTAIFVTLALFVLSIIASSVGLIVVNRQTNYETIWGFMFFSGSILAIVFAMALLIELAVLVLTR